MREVQGTRDKDVTDPLKDKWGICQECAFGANNTARGRTILFSIRIQERKANKGPGEISGTVDNWTHLG